MTAEQLVERARDRAGVRRYAGHASTVARLRTEVVDVSEAAMRLGLAETTAVDAYVAADALDALVSRHSLIRDDAGDFTLRATTMDPAVAETLARGTVLAALDLAESLDVRERRVGLDALTDALAWLRD